VSFLTVNLGVCFSIEFGCVFLTVNVGVCFLSESGCVFLIDSWVYKLLNRKGILISYKDGVSRSAKHGG
jgi:hypothetical protein